MGKNCKGLCVVLGKGFGEAVGELFGERYPCMRPWNGLRACFVVTLLRIVGPFWAVLGFWSRRSAERITGDASILEQEMERIPIRRPSMGAEFIIEDIRKFWSGTAEIRRWILKNVDICYSDYSKGAIVIHIYSGFLEFNSSSYSSKPLVQNWAAALLRLPVVSNVVDRKSGLVHLQILQI